MSKEAIFCKVFEFGGSNSHLRSMIRYFGPSGSILVLEEQADLNFLDGAEPIRSAVLKSLHPYAHLAHASFFSNLKETWKVLKSIVRIMTFCIQNGVKGITVSTVEPEKYLYFLWIPFIRVRYIVHSTPAPRFTIFTTFTCNHRLGRRKGIITVSNANKRALCEAWYIKQKNVAFVRVVYNSVSDNQAGNGSSPGASRNILTMGHAVAYKNPLLWLKTAKTITGRFNDVQFIWLGDGALLPEMKMESAGNERILFPGITNDPGFYLKNSAIYYQPSLFETHGIAVLEAMSHQLPCVVSNTGGLPESVEDGVNGILVQPADADQHVAALEKLLTDPDLRREYGQNGYKRFKELFSFERFRTEMDKIYLS